MELWTIFTTGDFVNQNAHKIVSQNWPFTTKSMAGDVLDKALIKKINRHNKKIWKFLESKGFKSPEKKYYADIKAERNKIEKALKIIEENPEVVKLLKKFRQKNLMDFVELIKLNDAIYEITIYSFNPSNLNEPQKFEIKLKANVKNEKVIVLKN